MIQTSLMLVGTSAVIATAIIFVCRPVLIAAVDAMRSRDLPTARVVFIGVWALVAVLAILCIVATAAVRLHSKSGETVPLDEPVSSTASGSALQRVPASSQ